MRAEKILSYYKILFGVLVTSTSVGLFSGCGLQPMGSPQIQKDQQIMIHDDPSNLNPNGNAGATPTPYGSQTATPTPTPVNQNTIPPLHYTMRGVGYSSTSVTVNTRDRLVIKFQPGIQDRTVINTGWSPVYSKLGAFITVNGVSQPTYLLRNGQVGSAQSQILDLSQHLPICRELRSETGTSTCRQSVQITVERPNNDYWCYTNGTFCTHTHVYDTHPWNAAIWVETNDTRAVSQ